MPLHQHILTDYYADGHHDHHDADHSAQGHLAHTIFVDEQKPFSNAFLTPSTTALSATLKHFLAIQAVVRWVVEELVLKAVILVVVDSDLLIASIG